jgi:ferritin
MSREYITSYILTIKVLITMIQPKVEKALNKHLAVEAKASNMYLAMASWCESQGYEGCAQYLYLQAEEERNDHFMKIFAFINERGGHAQVPALKTPKHEFQSLEELFTMSSDEEKHVTQEIYALVDLAQQEKDFGTFNFLQWFVEEQIEEEATAQRILDKIRLIGNIDQADYLIDKALQKMAIAKSSEEEEGE